MTALSASPTSARNWRRFSLRSLMLAVLLSGATWAASTRTTIGIGGPPISRDLLRRLGGGRVCFAGWISIAGWVRLGGWVANAVASWLRQAHNPLRAEEGQFLLGSGGVLSGVYRWENGRLVVVEPSDRRMVGLVWLWNADRQELRLIAEPANTPTGSSYVGAVLRRDPSAAPAK